MFPSSSNCPEQSIDDKRFLQYKCDDTSASHSFKHCSWDNNGLTSNGGAIHIAFSSSHSSISLTVDGCIFLHCHETNSNGAGAVYARHIGIATVENSLCYDCECAYNPDYPEGGGLNLNSIHTYPLIKSCSFVSCVSGDDAGGCGIWYSYSSITYAVDSCHCVKCEGIKQQDGEGGGIIFYENKNFVTCTNCLLYTCKAPLNAGGVCIYRLSSTTVLPIKFCFFRDNKSNGVRDVKLYHFSTSPQAITNSYSYESESGKVGGGSDNWLPQANTNSMVTGA